VKRAMTEQELQQENAAFDGTAGVSCANRDLRFLPAFMDLDTQRIYPSRFADGRLAPFHLLDGLPDEVIVDRAMSGRAVSAKASLIAGFVRAGFFYTRAAACSAARQWTVGPGAPGITRAINKAGERSSWTA